MATSPFVRLLVRFVLCLSCSLPLAVPAHGEDILGYLGRVLSQRQSGTNTRGAYSRGYSSSRGGYYRVPKYTWKNVPQYETKRVWVSDPRANEDIIRGHHEWKRVKTGTRRVRARDGYEWKRRPGAPVVSNSTERVVISPRSDGPSVDQRPGPRKNQTPPQSIPSNSVPKADPITNRLFESAEGFNLLSQCDDEDDPYGYDDAFGPQDDAETDETMTDEEALQVQIEMGGGWEEEEEEEQEEEDYGSPSQDSDPPASGFSDDDDEEEDGSISDTNDGGETDNDDGASGQPSGGGEHDDDKGDHEGEIVPFENHSNGDSEDDESYPDGAEDLDDEQPKQRPKPNWKEFDVEVAPPPGSRKERQDGRNRGHVGGAGIDRGGTAKVGGNYNRDGTYDVSDVTFDEPPSIQPNSAPDRDAESDPPKNQGGRDKERKKRTVDKLRKQHQEKLKNRSLFEELWRAPGDHFRKVRKETKEREMQRLDELDILTKQRYLPKELREKYEKEKKELQRKYRTRVDVRRG